MWDAHPFYVRYKNSTPRGSPVLRDVVDARLYKARPDSLVRREADQREEHFLRLARQPFRKSHLHVANTWFSEQKCTHAHTRVCSHTTSNKRTHTPSHTRTSNTHTHTQAETVHTCRQVYIQSPCGRSLALHTLHTYMHTRYTHDTHTVHTHTHVYSQTWGPVAGPTAASAPVCRRQRSGTIPRADPRSPRCDPDSSPCLSINQSINQ